MTGGSRLSHSLCNLIEVMSVVILEQYDQWRVNGQVTYKGTFENTVGAPRKREQTAKLNQPEFFKEKF